MHTAFITGCTSGFGYHLTRRLLADGHRVIATVEPPADPTEWAAKLDPNGTDRLLVLPLDVRDDAAVRAAAAAATAWAAVDVLVNNAGYAVFGSQEEADLDAIRDMFEVNVLGVARVTRALLPSLRATGGTVVQLASVAGRTVFTESGFYAASKHAVEAMSEALFQETCAFGVRVRVMEPGSFDTNFLARAAASSKPRDPASPYAAQHAGWDRRKFSLLERPQDPRLVADAIAASLADPAPFLRVTVGPDAAQMLAVRDGLGPDGWSRLFGDRAGLRAPHRPGDVPYPEEVLAADLSAPSLGMTRARIALENGHLEHWAESEVGRAALARLAATRTA